jgi:Co/Zn/Cd efflux system component
MPRGAVPLTPLLWVLAAYLALQLLLNLVLNLLLARGARTPQRALQGTFWAAVINALFFIAAAALLHYFGCVPERPPHHNYGLLALLGLPLGPLLWYVTTWGRKLGLGLFGRGELIAAEDAVLRVPPAPRYLGWGVANLALLQPLGRELFLRGAFLASVQPALGWGAAIAATLIVELLLRLNIVWLFQTLIYALSMCALFWLTHSALTGLVAAGVSGLIQAAVLIKLGGVRLRAED